tara:strand:+ start:219 stop:401 length:183 start_codon:yes stop_codon:yes gene_type:complete
LQNNNIIEQIIAVWRPKKDGSDARLVKPLDADDFANNKLEYTCSPKRYCGIQASNQMIKM